MTTRQNLCPNPALKNDTTDWGRGGLPAPTRLTGVSGFPRTTAARYTSGGSGNFFRTPKATVTAGQTYTLSVYIESDGNTTGTFYAVPINGSGGDINFSNSKSYSTTGGTPTRIYIENVTMPAGTVAVDMLVDQIINVTATCCLVEQVAAIDTYFDGDSSGGSWDGTPGNSTSTLTSGTSYNADATSATSTADSAGANLVRQGAATSTTSASDTAVAARTTYGAATSTTSTSDTATALRTTTGDAQSSTQAADSAGANLVRSAGATGLTSTADVATATVIAAGGTLFWPTGELVAMAWLRGVAGAPANAVSTNLPRDSSSWASTGFLQVESIGGGPNVDVPVSHVDIRVHCWAVKPKSSKPPWWMANQLAEIVRMGCYGNVDAVAPTARDVVLPDNYLNARVLSVVPLGEPQRVLLDEARFAHYQIDLRFNYTYIPAAS